MYITLALTSSHRRPCIHAKILPIDNQRTFKHAFRFLCMWPGDLSTRHAWRAIVVPDLYTRNCLADSSAGVVIRYFPGEVVDSRVSPALMCHHHLTILSPVKCATWNLGHVLHPLLVGILARVEELCRQPFTRDLHCAGQVGVFG